MGGKLNERGKRFRRLRRRRLFGRHPKPGWQHEKKTFIQALTNSTMALELLLNKNDPDLKGFDAEGIARETLEASGILLDKHLTYQR